jgi:uncharacterized protein (TIGR02466 family)
MTTDNTNVFTPISYFPTTLYTINQLNFLDNVKTVSEEYLNETKKTQEINKIYPVIMTPSLLNDYRMNDFVSFIAHSGWTILDNQGYDMSLYGTYVSELWCQEHQKSSGMEQHTHPFGVLLSGFYFLDVPDDSCMIQIYDSRSSKVQLSLPEKDNTIITEASNSMYIKPKNGMMVISNSWLPHSFTRNGSDSSCKFIHFNISVRQIQPETTTVV